MTDEARVMAGLCNDYLNGILNAEQFVQKFQSLFEDNQERLNKKEFDTLDEIYMACEYYQPVAEIRETEPYLLSEDELRNIVSQAKELNN